MERRSKYCLRGLWQPCRYSFRLSGHTLLAIAVRITSLGLPCWLARFHLPTGRQLTITSLDFHWTYEGLLVGSPNPSMNRDLVEQALKRAREARPWLQVHLLPPEIREPDCLPPACWVISFLSGALPNTDDIWSSLTVVWFAPYDNARPLVEQVAGH